MKREYDRLQRITDALDLRQEPTPGQSIVEIYGCHRVLIEKHGGITQYSTSRICVKVSYGTLAVCGNSLELVQMSRDNAVITGQIEGISICRRE